MEEATAQRAVWVWQVAVSSSPYLLMVLKSALPRKPGLDWHGNWQGKDDKDIGAPGNLITF